MEFENGVLQLDPFLAVTLGIVVPLVGAFFIDLANALLIPFYLTHFCRSGQG